MEGVFWKVLFFLEFFFMYWEEEKLSLGIEFVVCLVWLRLVDGGD